jgi:hypothetical protein
LVLYLREGKGRLTVDLAVWDNLLTSIGGQDNIKKAKIIGDDLLEFPNNIHIEVEDIIALAEQQKKLPVAGFAQRIQNHY